MGLNVIYTSTLYKMNHGWLMTMTKNNPWVNGCVISKDGMHEIIPQRTVDILISSQYIKQSKVNNSESLHKKKKDGYILTEKAKRMLEVIG